MGSGEWDRWDTKTIVENCLSLDVGRLSREGMLYPGADFSRAWSDRYGVPLATIGIRVAHDSVNLRYRTSWANGEGKEVTESILITWTPCNYGGRRPWFQCPGVVNDVQCDRRVAKLYKKGYYFLCRGCHDLAYSTQRDAVNDRPRVRAQRIRNRLGGAPSPFAPFPSKPKRMHYKSYFAMWQKAQKAELQDLGIVRESLDRLKARFP